MANYLARLRKGALTLNLDETTGLALMRDFNPPSAQFSNNITIGTGSNFYGGGEFISRKAAPISFSFTVRSTGTSNAIIEQQLDRLANFMALAGDKRDPVWFEFRPDNGVSFEPLWGQTGAYRRVEVLALESLQKISYLEMATTLDEMVLAEVTITVNMPVLGNMQRLAVGGGGNNAILEDWMGAKDGKSRGVMVPEATTNKMTNPVFGNSDWDASWTTGAGVLSASNTDRTYILFGNVSGKLIGIAGAANTFTQSIAAGNTNKHSAEFYVKRPDGAAVSSSDCAVLYGTAKTTTYTSIGNGWYKVSAVNFDGIAAATATGLTVVAGAVIYLSGAQLVEKAYNVPMTFGDEIGCTWSGTAHASTSSRTAAILALPIESTTFNYGQWTVRLVWKADRAITGVEKYLFCDSTTSLAFTWTAADKWNLSDGTNNALSAAKTIVAGTTYVFHLVASLSGLVVYLNGSSIATNATYTPPALASYLYIGTDKTGAKAPNGTFMGFTTYEKAMTQAEVTADYNNILPLVTADKRIDNIPYKNAYATTSNCNDANQTDWFAAGGIPGDVPAEMKIRLIPGQLYTKSIWIGNHVDNYWDWIDPLYRFYIEASGSATSAADSGGSVLPIPLPATATPRTGITRTVNFPDNIGGAFHFFNRMRTNTGTQTVSVGYYLQYNGGYIYSSDKTVSVNATSSWYYLGKLAFEPPKMLDAGELALTVGENFYSAGTSGTLLVDFGEVVNGDLCVIKQYSSDAPGGGGTASYPTFVTMKGNNAYIDTGTSNQLARVIGDAIELSPEAINTVTMQFASDAGAHVVADYLDISYAYVYPRWMSE